MLQDTAHDFAIGTGAFRVSGVFSNFACIRGAGVNPQNAWFSAPAEGIELFFSKMLSFHFVNFSITQVPSYRHSMGFRHNFHATI